MVDALRNEEHRPRSSNVCVWQQGARSAPLAALGRDDQINHVELKDLDAAYSPLINSATRL